jgi:hypothetical protein
VGEKRPGEPRGAVGLRPGGTANGEGGEGPPAPPAAAVAPTRSWVKEPWKGGDSASGKSGPGLASAKRDSTAERGGRDSAERGGPQRRAPSPTWRAAMGGADAAGVVPSVGGRGSPLPFRGGEGWLSCAACVGARGRGTRERCEKGGGSAR